MQVNQSAQVVCHMLNEHAGILENLTTSVLLVDHYHMVLYLNAAAETLLGISRNKAVGQSLSECLRGAHELIATIQRTFETLQPYAVHELCVSKIASHHTHQSSEQSEWIVNCRCTPVDDMGTQPVVLIEMVDTTQHQRHTREVALLNQVDGSRLMLRQLAHEIKNPLGGLRGAAQLLGRQLSDASLREYTSVIMTEADRLTSLVDALLGPGKVPQMESVNIHELLQHVRQLLLAEASAGIVVERDYDPSLPPLLLDRNQLIQALLNLGRNALQALETQPPGQLTLRTRALTNVHIGARRHRLVASVQFEDTGPGVPASLQSTLFYPFVTGRQTGTGLGLAVAQDLVSRHQGLIEFESRPGKTVFTVLLPMTSTKEISE